MTVDGGTEAGDRRSSGAPAGDRWATVVTVDGRAGTGKSTTARAAAHRLGYRYLDSGALYRALTYALLERGMEPERWSELERTDFSGLGLEVEPGEDSPRLLLDGRELDEELRSERVTARVSDLARLPSVRRWLLHAQRSAARDGRLVADGRDMGSVVFPEAWTKVFLRADPDERARRRLLEKGVEDPGPEELAEERRRLLARDAKDEAREHSPLVVPEGARVIDTTELDFEEQVEKVVTLARRARERARQASEGPTRDG